MIADLEGRARFAIDCLGGSDKEGVAKVMQELLNELRRTREGMDELIKEADQAAWHANTGMMDAAIEKAKALRRHSL